MCLKHRIRRQKLKKMKIKPKENQRVLAWNEYVETCRVARALYKKTVREALEKYQKMSRVSSAACPQPPEHQ